MSAQVMSRRDNRIKRDRNNSPANIIADEAEACDFRVGLHCSPQCILSWQYQQISVTGPHDNFQVEWSLQNTNLWCAERKWETQLSGNQIQQPEQCTMSRACKNWTWASSVIESASSRMMILKGGHGYPLHRHPQIIFCSWEMLPYGLSSSKWSMPVFRIHVWDKKCMQQRMVNEDQEGGWEPSKWALLLMSASTISRL